MKVSFDGLRKNLAGAYTKTVQVCREAKESGDFAIEYLDLKEGLDEMRQYIAALLCCYDQDSIKRDNDFHDLSDMADALPFVDPQDGEGIEDETAF